MMWIAGLGDRAHGDGEPSRPAAGPHNPNILCPYGVYETSDGGAFLLVVAMSDESWDDFWIFVDQLEVVARRSMEHGGQAHRRPGLHRRASTRSAASAAAFAPKTTAEWTEFLGGQPEII